MFVFDLTKNHFNLAIRPKISSKGLSYNLKL